MTTTAITTRISTNTEFHDLRDDWNRIVNSDDSYAVTNTWEWLYTWWQVFGDDRELYILVTKLNDSIIGIAPLLKRKVKSFKFLNKNRIEFLGSGEDEEDEICSDYLDFLSNNEHRAKAVSSICKYLLAHNSDWDELRLVDTRAESKNTKDFLVYMESQGKKTHNIGQAICPYIELPETWEELKRTSRINTREQINRKYRLLSKNGKICFTHYYSQDITSELFDEFIELHQQRWLNVGKPGCFSSQKFTNFHKALIFDENLMLNANLYFLELDGKKIATRFCYEYNKTIYDYQSGQLPDTFRNLSIGQILLSTVLESAIKNGFKTYDFFKGKKTGYKFKWTEKSITINSYLFK